MFDSVLLEVPRAERRRRKLTLAATLAGESLAIAALVAVPLLYFDAIPGLSVRLHAGIPIRVSAPEISPERQQPQRGSDRSVALIRATDEAVVRRTVADPRLVYLHWREVTDEVTTVEPLVRSGHCCDAGPDIFVGNSAYVPPKPHRPDPVRISQIEPGMILRRVEPQYPPAAKLARVQGEVVLQALIAADGTVEGLRVVSGHPMLAPAALAAVEQWLFRPYKLNGAPVAVEARITVRFVLGGD